MSLEQKIEQLTKAVEALTAAMQNQVTTAPVAVAAPVQQAPAPVFAPAPVVQQAAPAPVATAPVMPAPPTFAPAAPVQAAPAGVPFNDGKSLIEYVMARYKALGPEKGAQIQTVLMSLGYQNINDIKPEHYAQFHAGVEGIQ